jgi:predicted homoserine dehydrogenase-like protein
MDQMRTLKQRLLSLDKDIRVGIVGIGSTGRGLVYQTNITPGMRPAAIADQKIERAIECASWLKLEYQIVNTLSDLNFCVQCGKLAITDNADLIASSGLIHVFVDASNSAYHGALHGLKAIRNHQHVVMMNHAADLMYGALLFRASQEEGVVYTCCDGDQPAAMKKLIDEIELCGLDVVMVGAGENSIDRNADPVAIASVANSRGFSPKVCAAFFDGTSLNVNMSVLANAINGKVLKAGMLGPKVTHLTDILAQINFDHVWNGNNPIVDYAVSAQLHGGVFVVARARDPFQQQSLNLLPANLGKGPYYVFTRPFYLGHFEATQCIGEAYLEGTARIQPLFGARTNVMAYAKRALKQGERLDGAGGLQAYGQIENIEESIKPGLPILLSDNLKLKRDIEKDERISLEDVEFTGDDQQFSLHFQAVEISKLRTSKVREPQNSTYQLV